MDVLIAYGSKRGGTRGLAEMLAEALERRGLSVDVLACRDVEDVAPYGAVIVGGALYASRWHRDARRFVRRLQPSLEERPVWMFSSGPLDASATEADIAPVRAARRAMDRVGARGHVTFGGRLEADAKGFPASAMAKELSGDWRDPAHIDAWAGDLAEVLSAIQPATPRQPNG